MASVSKTRNGYWRVLWRDDQKVKRQKNFRTAAEARKFAAALELSPERRSSTITVSDWLVSYRDNESQKKRGAKQEILRINRFLQRPFASMKLGELSFRDLQKYFDDRLKEPSQKYIGTLAPATAHKELKTLSAAFNAAVKSGLIPKNPCVGVVLPKPAEHRERTASDEDIEALLVASGWDGKSVPLDKLQLTMAAFLLACKTGMRSGEILRIEEAWIDGAVIHLPHEVTKTDSRRDVALSSEALRILNLVRELGDKPQIFGALSDATRDALWRKIRDRAGLGPELDSQGRVIREGLNFHDSRATFATWAASPDPKTGAPRLDLLSLARQTGHKNLKMLQRYYRPKSEDIAKRLDSMVER